MKRPFLASLFTACLVLAPFTVSAFALIPATLSGTWQNAEKSESGALTVNITRQAEREFEGTIVIGGSDSCKEPIKFLGKISGKQLSIASSAESVCGRSGIFSIEATQVGEEVYTGTFSYLWRGSVWHSGTFRVAPVIPK